MNVLNFVDELDRLNLPSESIVVGFDIVNIFPSINNNFEMKAVFEILESRVNTFALTETVIEAIELCPTNNNSIFLDKNNNIF